MWFFNVFLYLLFVSATQSGNYAVYEGFVANGAPCYSYVALPGSPATPETPQPACFYDPSNTNSGY